MVDNNEEDYTPYCELCESCGEDGCCSHINCFRALVNANDKCKYGETYVREAIFNKKLATLTYELMQNIKEGKVDPNLVVEVFNRRWNDLWDEVYDKVYCQEQE